MTASFPIPLRILYQIPREGGKQNAVPLITVREMTFLVQCEEHLRLPKLSYLLNKKKTR